MLLKDLSQMEKNRGRWLLYFFLFLILLIVLKGLLVYVYLILSLNDYQATIQLPVTEITAIVVTCILGPIYEEVIFRLPLKFNIVFVRVSLCLFLADRIFRYETAHLFLGVGPFLSSRVFLFVVLASTCVFLTYQSAAVEKLQTIWENKFLWILVILQLIFGFAHLGQFDFDISGTKRFVPVIVLIFSVMGVFFAVIRMKLGMVAAIIFHCLFNAMYLIVDVGAVWRKVRDPFGRIEEKVREEGRHHMDSALHALEDRNRAAKKTADSLQSVIDSLKNRKNAKN
ncbi:CAAX protease self-immunity [Chryseolinea serpens]|uniref:CAAX protease self-immunity n=2 Tax=Chryseolinea serpens TaxID=947013 RepID=A0A1M5KW04_9BACT|nr:CAAX protease self-immunity [Chryseolinea serpens]